MKSILNFFQNYYFFVQSVIFLLMSLICFSDSERFWTFSFYTVVSFGLGEILSTLKSINQKLKSEE